MAKSYVIKEKAGKLYYTDAETLESPESLGVVGHDIRIKILNLLAKKPMYPAEIAKQLKMHEQKVYYHINIMLKAGILEIAERKEIRGTIAKKFRPKSMNFAVSLGGSWKSLTKLFGSEVNKQLSMFLSPFVAEGNFEALFVVGSPDPHGPFKAYARDGHYAVDLSMFFGQYCAIPDKFAVKLDVDVKLEKDDGKNLIVVGGPVTNTIMADINENMPVRFSDKKPWGIYSAKTGKRYTNDAVGLIVKAPNPFNKESSVIVLAGIRGIGTKAAVIALTRHHDKLLANYTGQKEWSAVVEGFDLDGDGKIDSVEIRE